MAPQEPSDEILYERAPSSDVEADEHITEGTSTRLGHPLVNFILLSILFSANHGTMVSCLAFATLQLGATGAWQLVLLHFVYGASSLLGATFVVKQLGSRNSMVFGMSLYALFVGGFWIVLRFKSFVDVFAVLGAFVAGTGGAFIWTAQGSYFGQAAQDYALVSNVKSETATSFLAGIFAFIFLVGEVICKLLSWLLLQSQHFSWTTVFGVYTLVAVASTLFMAIVYNYPSLQHDEAHDSIVYKMTAAWQLLRHDNKMPYMIGLNAVFGFAYPFVNSYVNGEVVHRVIPHDWNLHDVGLFSAISSAVAAICSLTFGVMSPWIGNGPILVGGSISFALAALLFIIFPNLDYWGWTMLSAVYCFQGVGRATVEGALRATYADFFPMEVEGAFANIILQNGIFTSLGFFLSFSVTCSHPGPYCVVYKEGGLHNVLVLELVVVVSAILAMLGYWKARLLFQVEQADRISENEEETRFMILSDERRSAASDDALDETR